MHAHALQARVVAHLREAHGMEQNVLRIMDCLVSIAPEAKLATRLHHHQKETEEQLLRLKERLAELGSGTRLAADRSPLSAYWLQCLDDPSRADSVHQWAHNCYITEQVEIVCYHLLERLAQRVGDAKTVRLAASLCRQEEAMADWIADRWDEFLEAVAPVPMTTTVRAQAATLAKLDRLQWTAVS
jgi:ferritin-like metal-binding protein YciE